VSIISILMLVAAALLVLGAQWPRMVRGMGFDLGARQRRQRAHRKARLKVVRPDDPDDADDFVQSVRRDLDRLPTVDRDHDRRKDR
jgi:hypothetical protein